MRWKQKFLKLQLAGERFDKQLETEQNQMFEEWEED